VETDKLMPDEKSVLREPQEVIIAPNPEALSEAAAGFWVDCAGRTIPPRRPVYRRSRRWLDPVSALRAAGHDCVALPRRLVSNPCLLGR
jgi:hypothetical protein